MYSYKASKEIGCSMLQIKDQKEDCVVHHPFLQAKDSTKVCYDMGPQVGNN